MTRALLATCLLAFPASATPSHCQPVPSSDGASGFRADVSAEAATYDNERGEGSYRGVSLGVGYRLSWLRLRLAAPFYDLSRDGSRATGPGDLLAELAVPMVQTENGASAAGVLLAGTAPTGNADRELGMGHVMLMPALWGESATGRWFLQAQLGYGRAVGDSETEQTGHDHHHHHQQHTTLGPSPIVNPMNESELTGGIAISYEVGAALRVRSGVYGAVPVAAENGEARGIVYLADDLRLGRFDLGVEGHVPFHGDPFTAKLMLTLGTKL